MLEGFDRNVLATIAKYLSQQDHGRLLSVCKKLRAKLLQGGILFETIVARRGYYWYFDKYKEMSHNVKAVFAESYPIIFPFPNVRQMCAHIHTFLSHRMNLTSLVVRPDAIICNTRSLTYILSQINSTLVHLDLSCHSYGVDDKIISFIVSSFPKLEYLDVAWCGKITADGFRRLRKLESLRWLNTFSCEEMYEDDYFHFSKLEYFDAELIKSI